MKEKKKDNILITGFSGFVGRHFLKYLYDQKISANICGIDIKEPSFLLEEYEGNDQSIHFVKCDLLNIEEIRRLFTTFKPDYILHLASFSSVAFSWKHPTESFMNNTNIFLNLITVVQEFNADCRILSIGSSEEYGNVSPEDLPLMEAMALQPVSPYAAARVSQEILSKIYVDSYHLNIIMTRSFNHIGIWQDERFVVPSFVRKIIDIKQSGQMEGTIETGDTTIVRDFVDVRDVVEAYYLLLKKGTCGEIYNICAGAGYSLDSIIQMISDELQIKIGTRINPEFLRPNDNRAIVGSYAKIKEELGWEPHYHIKETIHNMVTDSLQK